MKYTMLFSVMLSISQTVPAFAETYGMPFRFEANRGQAQEGIKYIAYAAGFTADLNVDEVRLNLEKPLTMRFSGRSANAWLEPQSKMPLRSNHYRGSEGNWHTDIENYERIQYRNIYPGIDVVFRGTGRILEFDFITAPRANTNAIALEFQGAETMTIADDGSLILKTPSGEARLHPPSIFQGEGSNRRSIAGRFITKGNNRIGIEVATYDAARSLLIDPALTFSTYADIGGNETPTGIALDRLGNIYVAYTTFDAFDENEDQLVVQKISRDGSPGYITHIWELFTNSQANGLVVDAAGNVYVAGTADNTPPAPTVLPSKAAIQPHDAGGTDAYIVKLDKAGQIVFATYLGGSGDDSASSIALDGVGGVWIGGTTSSTNFPTRNAFQGSNGGGMTGTTDGFLTKIDAAGTQILYSTYLGGPNNDAIRRLAIDAAGAVIVAETEDGARIFVRKFNAAGTAILHSASAGQAVLENDFMDFSLAHDGSIYVARTEHAAGLKYFLDKINSSFELVYSKPLPAEARGVATDPQGNVYLTGGVVSDAAPKPLEFPVVNSFRLHAASDAYVMKLPADGSFPLYSTLLSGTCTFCLDPVNGQGSNELGDTIAVDSSGRAFVAGISSGEDFPTTNGTRRSGVSRVSQVDPVIFVLDTIPSSTTEFTRLEEWFPPVVYSGNWYTQNSSTAGHSGNSARLAMDTGSKFSISFTGSGDLKWYGCSDQYAGIATLFLDGTLRATVDTYGSPGACHQLLGSITGIPGGAHTFTVVVTGTKSAISKGKWVWIDDVEIMSAGDITLNTTAPPNSGGGGSFTRFEENSAPVQLTSTWNVNSMTAHSGGRAVLSASKGARATFSFNGTAARWLGWQDRWSGIAKVYVDGVFKADIDTYSAADKSKQVLYEITGLAAGNHSLAVEVAGRHNALAAESWVWVDAFEVLGTANGTTPPPPTSLARVEQDNPAVTKTGTWNTHSATMHSGGSAILSINAGSRAAFSFTGTEIRWIGLRDPWSGIARVYIDGVLKGTIDTYAATTQSRVVLYSLTGLSAGTHTITVEATGTRSSSASSAWVWVDAFDYR